MGSMYVLLFLVAGRVLVESIQPVKVVSAHLLGSKILGVLQQSVLKLKKKKPTWCHFIMSTPQARDPLSNKCYFSGFYLEIF